MTSVANNPHYTAADQWTKWAHQWKGHINNTGNGSVFGYAFFPGLLSLVTWTIATSVARYRAVAT